MAPTNGAHQRERLASVQALALAAFALVLLASSMQPAESASFTAVGKQRSNRDRGK